MGVPGISSTRSQVSKTMYYSGPFQTSHSFCLSVCTLSLRLLGQTWSTFSQAPGTILVNQFLPPGFCPQVERGAITVRPQPWFQLFPATGLFSKTRSVADNHQTKLFSPFPFAFDTPSELLDLVGRPSTLHSL